jgi:hypothetical protein
LKVETHQEKAVIQPARRATTVIFGMSGSILLSSKNILRMIWTRRKTTPLYVQRL